MKQSIPDFQDNIQQALKMIQEHARIEALKPVVLTMGHLQIFLVSVILTCMVGIIFNMWWDCCEKHPREKGQPIRKLLITHREEIIK